MVLFLFCLRKVGFFIDLPPFLRFRLVPIGCDGSVSGSGSGSGSGVGCNTIVCPLL
jgi:hypothetical protein